MNRFQAAGIHLGISFLIFIVLAYLVVFEWYPGFFFDTDGGWRGMRIIIGVDLILGPMLTLVVYKAGKPGLKFDLGFIALLQTVCLIAGTYVVWAERPLAIVYVDSRFEVMTTDDYTVHQLDVPQFSLYPGDDPKWLAVDVPSDPDAQSELRKELFGSGASLSRAAEFYKPFNGKDPVFQAEARDVTVRYAIHPVAGRMPGHMNVLLAESSIPYEQLVEMDVINSEFKNTDAVIVIGANDVVNPVANQDPASPIYGMPILNAHEARSVFVIKRSLSPGYAGIKNDLFEYNNTMMVFGDAKGILQNLVTELKDL